MQFIHESDENIGDLGVWGVFLRGFSCVSGGFLGVIRLGGRLGGCCVFFFLTFPRPEVSGQVYRTGSAPAGECSFSSMADRAPSGIK